MTPAYYTVAEIRFRSILSELLGYRPDVRVSATGYVECEVPGYAIFGHGWSYEMQKIHGGAWSTDSMHADRFGGARSVVRWDFPFGPRYR